MEKASYVIWNNFVVHDVNKSLVEVSRGGLWVHPKQLKWGMETKYKTKNWYKVWNMHKVCAPWPIFASSMFYTNMCN